MRYNLEVETAWRGFSVTIQNHPLFAYRYHAAVSTTEQMTGDCFKENAMKQDVVYIVKCHNFYKIGITDDIKRRLIGLQTGNPYELELVKVYQVPTSFESTLHEVLDHCHIRGEWFKMTPATLEVIMEVCQIYEDDCNRRKMIQAT